MTHFSDTSGLPTGGVRLKGNLHAHTTNSDGALTPEESVRGYREHGYNFLCLSEHDLYTDLSSEFDDDDFVILPGLEASAYLYADETEELELRCHHMHGILGSDEMVARAGKRFSNMERVEPLRFHGSWDGRAVAQQLADMLMEHGCLVTYNHPLWSRVEHEDVRGLTGCFGIEVCNYGTVNQCGLGEDTTFWDMMLRDRIRIGPLGGDDAHNHGVYSDAYGGWIVVCCDGTSRDAIVRALAEGSFYASSGPSIVNYGVEGDEAWIETSPCERITLIAGGPVGIGRTHISEPGGTISHTTFPLKGTETYLRFECADKHGRRAWSGALFADIE